MKMLRELRELWAFRELLFAMVQRELKVRYKNSILGFFWSFLNPLLTTLVMTVVFAKLMHNNVQNFSAYYLAAYLPFMFFTASVMDSAQSILASLSLVKKVYFPREILPLAIIVSNFIHLILGFAVFFLLLLIVYLFNPGEVPFRATTIYLPVLLVISFALATGLGLLISALNTFYEDVKYIVSVVMYLMFFLCPIMYFIETVADSEEVANHPLWFKLYMLNPVADLSAAYRQVLLAPQPIYVNRGLQDRVLAQPYPLNWGWIAYSAVFSLAILILGYSTFNRLKWRFVERP